MPEAGPFGLISQSGALCTALLDYAKGVGIGFSRFVSFGNKVAVSENDLLLALAADPLTKAILMYVEELSQGQRFIDTCHQITHGTNPKPIIAIKTGRTQEGAAAAASHTGSLAGRDEVYDAVFAQAGVQRVDSVKELFDCAEVFVDPTLPAGRRTAIVTNAGGPGIMATDACIRNGMVLAKFQEYTLKSLRYQLPPTSSLKNPVDVIGDAKAGSLPGRAGRGLRRRGRGPGDGHRHAADHDRRDRHRRGDPRDQDVLRQADRRLPDGARGCFGGRAASAQARRAGVCVPRGRDAGDGRQVPFRGVDAPAQAARQVSSRSTAPPSPNCSTKSWPPAATRSSS